MEGPGTEATKVASEHRARAPQRAAEGAHEVVSAAPPAPKSAGEATSTLETQAELEALMGQWHRGIHIMHIAHSKQATTSERWRRILGSTVVVLSTVVGTSFFASVQQSLTSTRAQVILGLLGVLAGALAAVQGFFNFGTLAEGHRTAASAYGKLRRNLELMMSRSTPVTDAELAGVSATWTEVEKSAPIIGQRTYAKAEARAKD